MCHDFLNCVCGWNLRGRVASAVSQSTTVLDLSAKKSSVDRTKPPRRLSIPNKTSSSSVTSVSESKVKRSGIVARSLNETPFSSVLRSAARRKAEDLSSSAYWLTHIKLAESVGKHSISLGFFKLALHAGCEVKINANSSFHESFDLVNKP